MADYLPLDLSSLRTADLSLLPHPDPPTGKVLRRGLPFDFGAGVIRLDGASGPVEIPLGRPARHVIVAHVLPRTDLYPAGPVGVRVADYRFHLADGTVDQRPLRERFEIGIARPPWGQLCFAAWPDQPDSRPARYEGPFAATGFRLTAASQGTPRHWYFWVWSSPRPEIVVERLEIVPAGPEFLIGAITVSRLAEEPFCRTAAAPVIIDTTDGVERRGELEVEVDRGVATYAYALPAEAEATWLADPLAGFGQPQNPLATPATAAIAASDSATITVKHGEEVLGRVNWGQVAAGGAAADKVVVRLAEGGRNWVHTRVVDAETGEPLPCRIHFRSLDGVPYQPHGHHNYACDNLGSWHQDVGGDLRLGQATYAYIDGTCQGWLPRGELLVDVARGFEYEPVRQKMTIEPWRRQLEIRLHKVRDMNAERYFSGDSHVHFLSTEGAHTEAAGEGLNVVNLLQSQWGQLFTNTEEFRGEPSVRAGQRTIVYATQENRQHILGHLTLLGLKRPVMPWCSGGPSESYLGDNLEVTLARWADACHEQGGTVILPHLPNPNGEPAALVATGRVDAVEWLTVDSYNRHEYYRYLNAGYRLPLVGGTDKMTQDVPVGLYRTYVQIPDDEEFTYDNWCRHLRGGNTFLSGGPLLTFTVDGQPPGRELTLLEGGTVAVEAVATSIFPIRRLQIVCNGRVVAEAADEAGTRRLELADDIRLPGHCWLAARVADGDDDYRRHHDGWRRGIVAHTSPVYVGLGGVCQLHDPDALHYLLTLVDGSLTYLREMAPHFPHDHERVTHHHDHGDHRRWLEEPFHQAREALHRRLHQAGIPH